MTPSGPLSPLQWLYCAGLAAIIAAALYAAGQWLRRGSRDLDRIGREAPADRRPVTRPLPLAGLVIDPELERHAAWRAAQLAREAATEVIPGLDDEEGWPWP